MKKEEARIHIEKSVLEGDSLVGFFIGQGPFPIWWFLLLGPFGFLFLKTYYVGVTNKGISFFRLSLIGKFKDNGDFFAFDEIESVEIKKGIMQRPILFTLKNGTKVKIKAQLKGLDGVAKLTPQTQSHIEKHIPQIS